MWGRSTWIWACECKAAAASMMPASLLMRQSVPDRRSQVAKFDALSPEARQSVIMHCLISLPAGLLQSRMTSCPGVRNTSWSCVT